MDGLLWVCYLDPPVRSRQMLRVPKIMRYSKVAILTPPESSWDYTPMKMDGLYMVSTGKSQEWMITFGIPPWIPPVIEPPMIFPGRAQKLQPLGSHQNSWHTNINVHLLHESSTSFKTSPNLGIPFMEHSQWEFQDPKMEVPAIRPIFPGYASGDISPISMA